MMIIDIVLKNTGNTRTPGFLHLQWPVRDNNQARV